MRVRLLLLLAIILIANRPLVAQTVTSLTLESPQNIDGLFVDNTGILYGAGTFQGRTVVSINGAGEVSSFAFGLTGPIQTTRSTDGNFYVTNFNTAKVSQITPEGVVSDFATVKDGPSGIVSDKDGNLYVTQYGVGNGTGNSVTKIALDGTVTDFAVGGTINVPVGIAIDDEGNIYTANLIDGRITKITPAGEQSLFASPPAGSPFTIGHLVWANGQLFGTHVARHQIYVFEEGSAEVYAGSGTEGRTDGPAESATFTFPNGLAASVTGDTLYVAEALEATANIRLVVSPTVTNVEEDNSEVPDNTQLMQNYPNPFRGQTAISFTLARTDEVQIDVFDVLGRRVKTVANGTFASGQHTVLWNGAAEIAGVYYYRLQTDTYSATQQMIMLK